ncbi:MAG: LCP family protein, partial [Acidimicrobiia bacterium]|nr:LCP family protein [Acidimicrobiia bacterium]
MKSRGNRPRRTWPERLLVGFGVVAATAFGLVIYGLNVAQDKVEDIQRVVISPEILGQEVATGEPRNILVVGIDSAAGLDPDDPRAVDRPESILTDTMMIVRLDPAAESVAILSIPRDLWVPIAGSGQPQKINAAVAVGGGPDGGGIETLIETIEENFGIPINNFVQIDFVTFLGVVDAIDGVPYVFEHPIRDTELGLLITRTGCQTVGADDSLSYVRSRKLEEQIDGQWVDDGIAPDLERIRRQQAFVVAIVNRGVAKGARNPLTLNELVNAVIDDVLLDSTLSADEMLEIGDQFRTFQTKNLQTLTFTGLFDIVVNGSVQALALPETGENEATLDIFRGVEPGELTEESISVRVLDGTSSALGAGAASELEAAGFVVLGFENAPTFDEERTTIRHRPDTLAEADIARRWIDGDIVLEVAEFDGADLEILLGGDWTGVRDAIGPAPTPVAPQEA